MVMMKNTNIIIIIKLIIIMPFFLEHRRMRIWDIYAKFHFSERVRSLSKKKQLWVVKVTHFQPQLRVHNLLAALPQWICFEASELREGSHLR